MGRKENRLWERERQTASGSRFSGVFRPVVHWIGSLDCRQVVGQMLFLYMVRPRSVCRADLLQIEMRSLGWVLIQYDWCLYKRRHRDTNAGAQGRVMTGREEGHQHWQQCPSQERQEGLVPRASEGACSADTLIPDSGLRSRQRAHFVGSGPGHGPLQGRPRERAGLRYWALAGGGAASPPRRCQAPCHCPGTGVSGEGAGEPGQ